MKKQLVIEDNSGRLLYASIAGYVIYDNYERILRRNGVFSFTGTAKLFSSNAAAEEEAQRLSRTSTGLAVYSARHYVKWSYAKPKIPFMV